MRNTIDQLLSTKKNIFVNPDRRLMIEKAIKNREVHILKTGTLATWTMPDSTGRSPKDTVTVRRKENESIIDWDSPYNIPITEETFDMLFEDALENLDTHNELYVTQRMIGADPSYGLQVTTITPKSLAALFTDNMFRPLKDTQKSILNDKHFTLIVFPHDKLHPERYEGKLRKIPECGKTTDMAIAIDYERSFGIVFGSGYLGSIKKLMFTVMNYYLPFQNILPLHCSANEGNEGDIALFLGLSGTGKTSLSTSSDRILVGDDEHGWSDSGIANFENGCYAKLINLDPNKEPEIYHACFHNKDVLDYGAIVENVMIYPDGSFDLEDKRLTENSRGSYPLSFIPNSKESAVGDNPKTIILLTADANGVLPPISKLNNNQAMFWFLMGYTSILAGTETGITEPKSTFSRFFGAPFMPALPHYYTNLLGEKLKKHDTEVFLVNTGWVGGPYGTGHRIDIRLTRQMVKAALNGEIGKVEYDYDKIFHLNIPKQCPGLDDKSILNPKKTWKDKKDYDKRAKALAKDFADHFKKTFRLKGLSKEIEEVCPGF